MSVCVFFQWFTAEIVGSMWSSIVAVFVVINSYVNIQKENSTIECCTYTFSKVVDLYVIADRSVGRSFNVNQDYHPVHKFIHIRSWFKKHKKKLPTEFPKRMFTQYISQFVHKNGFFVSSNLQFSHVIMLIVFMCVCVWAHVCSCQERKIISVCHSKFIRQYDGHKFATATSKRQNDLGPKKF